jgi:Tol biopolymer transport system component
MHKPLTTFSRQAFLGMMICGVALAVSAQALSTETVIAELVRLQGQTGLTLAWVDNRIQTESLLRHTEVQGGVEAISFKRRAIVPLTDSLQAFRPDGYSSREYPEVSGIGMCWSHDQTRLASTMINHSTRRVSLGVLDLNSKRTREVTINVDHRPYVTSQCWSPDDENLIYETDGIVRIYEIVKDRSNALASGTDPTWSPDGHWIAFRDRDTYYAIHPDGSGRKKLFHNHWGSAVSALYWSPDSRIVAYVRELGFLQGGWLDAEVNQLRVRRLEDGSESRLCPDSVDWYANYHWITSSELKSSEKRMSR